MKSLTNIQRQEDACIKFATQLATSKNWRDKHSPEAYKLRKMIDQMIKDTANSYSRQYITGAVDLEELLTSERPAKYPWHELLTSGRFVFLPGENTVVRQSSLLSSAKKYFLHRGIPVKLKSRRTPHGVRISRIK